MQNNPLFIPLVGLLGVVLGCLLTGGFSLVNSYFQSVAVEEREKNKLILEKLENLFETLGTLREFYAANFKTFHRYLIRTEAVPVAAPDDTDSAIKVLCLQSFYAPTLKDKVSQIFDDIREFTAFRTSVLLFLGSGSSDADEINRILLTGKAAIKKINETCLLTQEELAKLSKDYLK